MLSQLTPFPGHLFVTHCTTTTTTIRETFRRTVTGTTPFRGFSEIGGFSEQIVVVVCLVTALVFQRDAFQKEIPSGVVDCICRTYICKNGLEGTDTVDSSKSEVHFE